MPIASMLVHTVSILTPAETTDRRGSTVKDWAEATTQAGVAAWMHQRSTVEIRDGREARVTSWAAFLPATATITAMDRIVWDSRTFEVAGDPLPAHGGDGSVHHYEVPLKIVGG